MQVYQGKISYLLPILFFPSFFTIAVILDAYFFKQLFSVSILLIWVPFILLMFVPLVYKLEIGSNYVKNTFLGFTIMKLSFENIESVTYGNVYMWGGLYNNRGFIYGKGLAVLTYINGTRKVYGISEKLYGKKAINNIKYVLKISM